MNRIGMLITALLLTSTNIMAQEEEDFDVRGHIEHIGTGQMLSPQKGMRRIGTTATAPLTCMGSPKVPVILVQFADSSFSVKEDEEAVKQAYQELFNAAEGIHPGTAFCSVKEYFREQSDGQFTPDFDIIGPVTLSKNLAYYGEDKNGVKDIHINEFYTEACQLAVAQHEADWNRYDNDGNGVVDFIFFIYAGHGQNQKGIDSNAIWPKEKPIYSAVKDDNSDIYFGSIGCTCELYKNNMDGIGACIHELCHGLGLPDFYDTNYQAYGLDYWDVMDTGCYKISGRMPVGFSAYERDFMGWRKLVELNPDSAYSLTLAPLETGGVAYKVVNKANENEYFILENRQEIGSDKYLGWATSSQYTKYGANHGLMITHVDYSLSAWNLNTVNTDKSHQRITIVPADGELISSNERTDSQWAISLHGDLYPGDNNVTEMSSYDVFTGGTLGLTIDNIVEHEDGTITLDINGGKKAPDNPDNPDNPEDPDGLYEPDVPSIA